MQKKILFRSCHYLSEIIGDVYIKLDPKMGSTIFIVNIYVEYSLF